MKNDEDSTIFSTELIFKLPEIVNSGIHKRIVGKSVWLIKHKILRVIGALFSNDDLFIGKVDNRTLSIDATQKDW